MVATAIMYISGCASISKEQCELGDWYQIGLADGQKGKENSAADYSKDCAEFKVKVDLDKYNQGRAEGLNSYCSYDNGVFVGEQAGIYQNVCPADLSAEFLAGYRPHFNVTSTQNKIRDKRIEASVLEETIKDKETDKNTKSDAKANLKVVKEDIRQLNDSLNTYEYELAIHKIDREIMLTQRQLEDAKEQDKVQIVKRLKELQENKSMIEDMKLTEEGIRSIKSVVELFK